MYEYIDGAFIKKMREDKKLTQSQLAEKIGVTDKAVSKWETGRGYPDISLLSPLSDALGLSVSELLAGRSVTNQNKSFNMKKRLFYVCPVCGNIICRTGESDISCCGISLLPQETEKENSEHIIDISLAEDEYYISTSHPMTKDHYISFVAAVSDNGVNIIKMYPEGDCEARFKIGRTKYIYYYCNRHGLFALNLKEIRQKLHE